MGRGYVENRTADERTTLNDMMEWYRAGVVEKTTGLSDAEASQRRVASATTVVGVVKHLAYAEDWWWTNRFAGRPDPEPWASAPWDDDPDWDFTSAVGEPLADALALYEQACGRSRAVFATAQLDDTGAQGDFPFTCRWMLVHMIEETARHLGHLDILREQIDGAVGN